MIFKFYYTESKIYDFLHFPNLIFAKERQKISPSAFDTKDINMEGYMNFVNMVEKKLKPYKKDIELFYTNQFFNMYDLIVLISNVNTIFGYKDEKEYLSMLLELSETQIISSMAYSLLISNEDTKDYSEEVMKKAEYVDKNELVSTIKELAIEPAAKWNLFLVVDEPINSIKKYVNLMYSILPIFEEMYLQYKEEVNNYGQYLVDFLNKNGSAGINEATYSIIDMDIFNAEENNVLISAVYQYALMISGGCKTNYILWGLKVNGLFKKMKMINENSLNERVLVFKNLGDKTRYEVLKLLAMGEKSTKEIAKALGVSSATISYHLNNLLQAKIIKATLINNKYEYIVNYLFIEKILNDLKEDIK